MPKRDYRLVNNGDDWGVWMRRTDLRKLDGLADFFDGLGYKMKLEDPVDVLELCDFCQMRPIYDGVDWRMIRNFWPAMAKDLFSPKPVYSEKDWTWRRKALADCGLSLSYGIPVVDAFYMMVGRGADGAYVRREVKGKLAYLASRMKRGSSEVTDAARVSFFRAFDVTPDRQVALELHLSKVQPTWSTPLEGKRHSTEIYYND